MPTAQKRKCSVSLGDSISFLSIPWRLSMAEEYSLAMFFAEGSEEAGDALFKHNHFIFHAGFQRFALQQLQRLFDGFVR